MTARIAVELTLPGSWARLSDAPGSSALRWRLVAEGRVLAALSLESLTNEAAAAAEFAAAAAADSSAWRRTVEIDGADETSPRVIVRDLDRVGRGGEPRIRRTGTLTWFLPDGCLQLRLVTEDLFAFGDLGASLRGLADGVRWAEAV